MPKKPTSPLIEETGLATEAADKPWSLAVIFDRRTFQPVGQDHRGSEIGRDIEACLAQLCSRPASGYLAVCAVGTADWHQLAHRREVIDWLSAINRRLKPLVKTAIRTSKDAPDQGAKPFLAVDRSQLWLRVFCDLELAPIQHRVHDYYNLKEELARKPVPESPKPDERSQHIDALLATVPKDAPYEDQAIQLEGLIRDVRQQAAARLLPPLKEEMARRNPVNYDDKKDLVGWVNAELRRFGVAIRFPNSDRAATLVAVPGNKPEEGRFQLRSEDEVTGKDKTFNAVHLSKLLAVLELIEAAPRRESILEWREKVARPKRGSSRT